MVLSLYAIKTHTMLEHVQIHKDKEVSYMEKKRRTVFYRNKYFWIIIIILAIVLWSLSTVISGRRAKMTNNLNSMPAVHQQVETLASGFIVDLH